MKINVYVKAGSKKGDQIEETGSFLTVFLRAKAKDDKANASLVKLLAKYYKIPKNRIKILIGKKSRNKIIEVGDAI